MKCIWPITLLMLSIFSSHAISTSDYETQFKKTIFPHFIKSTEEGTFLGTDGISIYFRKKESAELKRCLVILPGRSEPIVKYAEVFYDLEKALEEKNSPHHIFLMDHRGQGLSGRETSNSQTGYVKRFDHYIQDLRTFVDTVVKPSRCLGVSVVAHSMGAGITLAYTHLYPDSFDRLVFSSPMLKIQTDPYPYLVARSIVQAQVLAGNGKNYAPGQGNHNPNAKFEENRFTTSPERFKMAQDIFEWYPTATLGGVSNNWIYQVMKGTNDIRKNYPAINPPMVVFTAGTELYSDPKEMKELCDKALDCQRLHFPTAKHEIFMDRDENRSVALEKTIEILTK